MLFIESKILLMYRNKAFYVLILVFFILSCKQRFYMLQGNTYLYQEALYSCKIELKEDSIMNVYSSGDILISKESGKWHIIKDTLFFFQNISKQDSSFSLINEKYDSLINGTVIKLFEGNDSLPHQGIFIINDNILKNNKLYYGFKGEYYIPDTLLQRITIGILLSETFYVNGNYIEFYYNNPEIVLGNVLIQKKFIIKRNKLIPIEDDGEVNYNYTLKKL